MSRILATSIASLGILVSAAQAFQGGGNVLLDKKDSLSDKDPAYKPDPKGLPAGVDQDLVSQVDGHAHKVYTIKLTKGDKLVIEVTSADLDPVVAVEDAGKKILAMNDDDEAGGTQDSKLEWTVPSTAEYRIVVTCFEMASGNFNLTVKKAGEKKSILNRGVR
jgi:hypothetical protein